MLVYDSETDSRLSDRLITVKFLQYVDFMCKSSKLSISSLHPIQQYQFYRKHEAIRIRKALIQGWPEGL